MNIENAIAELKNCGDFQGYHLGAQIEAGLDETVQMMEKDGFSSEEARAGIANYCMRVADALRRGEDVDLPFYREDEIGEYEAECIKERGRLSLCA